MRTVPKKVNIRAQHKINENQFWKESDVVRYIYLFQIKETFSVVSAKSIHIFLTEKENIISKNKSKNVTRIYQGVSMKAANVIK